MKSNIVESRGRLVEEGIGGFWIWDGWVVERSMVILLDVSGVERFAESK